MDIPIHPHRPFAVNRPLAFLLLCLVAFLLLFVKKSFIESETAVFEFLQDRPEGGFLQLVAALQFLSIPLIYFWKLTVVAFILWIGCFLYGYRVTYGQCWMVALVAEFLFLLPEGLKIFWFMVVDQDPSYHAIRSFYPLSLMHFFDENLADKRYAYPLKALNLFEVAYWGLLTWGIHLYARKKIKVAGFIVASSYVLFFLLWLLFYIAVYKE